MTCQADARPSSNLKHKVVPIEHNVEKFLTPKSCLVCQKLVIFSSRKGDKQCVNCKEVVHQKCEKFLTIKCSGAIEISAEERAFMTSNLSVTAIERENVNIQHETMLLRHETHLLQKLHEQIVEQINRQKTTSKVTAVKTHFGPEVVNNSGVNNACVNTFGIHTFAPSESEELSQNGVADAGVKILNDNQSTMEHISENEIYDGSFQLTPEQRPYPEL